MVATDFSSRVLCRNRVVRGSGVEDLALLKLELGLVHDPGVTELAQLTQLGQLRVRVGPGRRGRRLRRRLGVLRRWGLLRLLVGPPVALPTGDSGGHGGGGGRRRRGGGGPPGAGGGGPPRGGGRRA